MGINRIWEQCGYNSQKFFICYVVYFLYAPYSIPQILALSEVKANTFGSLCDPPSYLLVVTYIHIYIHTSSLGSYVLTGYVSSRVRKE